MHTQRIGRVALAVTIAFALGALLCMASPRLVRADRLTNQKDLLPPPSNMMDDPPVPDLSATDKAWLVKLARAAIEYSAQTGKVYEAKQVPPSLAGKDYLVHVSARVVGKQVASVLGDGTNLVENVTAAAAMLAGSKDFGSDKLTTISSRKECVLELDILGPGQLLPADKFPRIRDVSTAIMPGVHGLSARITTSDKDIKSAYLESLGGRATSPRPAARPEDLKPITVTVSIKESDASINGRSSDEVVSQLFKNMGWKIEEATQFRNKIAFFRYRTCHLLEQPGEPGYVELFRCAQLVEPEQIDRARLDDRIDMLGQYLCYRQLESGLFSYCYCPWTGLYDKADNGWGQAGAAWAMGRLARLSGKPDYELAALKAIAAAKIRYLDPARDKAAAGYDFEPAGQESLGASAMLLGATADGPANKLMTSLRDKLAAGVLSLQQPDGSLRVFFWDRNDENLKLYYPGQALAALMKVYQATSDKKILDAVEKAFKVSHDLFQTTPSRPFCAWQLQAWAAAYDATGKKEYLDFVFQMADWLVGCQASDLDRVYPDVVGAFGGLDEIPGAATASYLQGLVAAHRLAVKAADAKRAAKYARALLLGARYIDQLTFKKVEAFYCVTPKDAVGGVKASLNDPRVRIDYCHQALMALLDIRGELFGK